MLHVSAPVIQMEGTKLILVVVKAGTGEVALPLEEGSLVWGIVLTEQLARDESVMRIGSTNVETVGLVSIEDSLKR